MGSSVANDWGNGIAIAPPLLHIANNVIVQIGDSTNPGNLAAIVGLTTLTGVLTM